MRSVFIRDVVIAVLLSIITAMLANEPCLAYCMPIFWLFCVIGVEEYTEILMGYIHTKRTIKKLRNRKVLPPTKARQD